MNKLQRWLARMAIKGTDLTLISRSGWVPSAGGNWTLAPVNDATQFQIAAAFSCIRLISETVGTLPLKLYKSTDKGRITARDHYLYPLVTEQPNDYLTAIEWKEMVAIGICAFGQAYNRVHFRPDGKVHSIEPVIRYKVSPELIDGEWVYWYTTRDGQRLKLTRREICPVRGFGNVDELEGFSPARLLGDSFGLTSAVEKYGAQFFGSGGRPSGVLKTSASLKAEQRHDIRENFTNYVKESWESGRPPLLESGVEYQSISTANNEAQFIETRKLQIAEIARIYRVPMPLLMEVDKSSYNNTQQANKHFLDYTLMPYLIRIEQALNSCLLTEKERKDHYFQFDVRGLLRGDSEERSNFYQKMVVSGVMTVNEIRDLEDYPRIEGADDLMVPLNMAPLDTLRDIQGKE